MLRKTQKNYISHNPRLIRVKEMTVPYLIDFFLDTVSLPHKPFCAARQYER